MKFEILKSVGGILKRPGDSLEAYITPTGRQVAKIINEYGKVSACKYPTGKIVLTKVIDEFKM